MENVKPLESKKWTLIALGMFCVMISGAAAVVAGPVAVSVLPQVIGGIMGLAGVGVVTQGYQDTKTNVATANNIPKEPQ